MKKDKEWLKEEIKVFQKGENMFTAEFNAGVQQALEYVQELIDQLDEPETLSEEWIENHTSSADTISYYSEESVPVVTVIKLKNLLVPKQDKPVIPKFVADYIETYKGRGFSLVAWFEFVNDEDEFENKTEEWLYSGSHEENLKREYLLIDAIRYGYEVEKEKNYEVTIGKGTWGGHTSVVVLYKSVGKTMVLREMSEEYYEDSKRKAPTSFWLTEKEIKDYDERYWTFAEEVTPCN